MDNIPRTHEDIEAQIREIQSKKKEIVVEVNDRGVGLGESGFFDSEIYDGGGRKGKYEGYVTSIAANDEDDENEGVEYWQKRTGLGAPVALFNDIAQSDKDYDPFADKRRPTIADREDEYRQKRLHMTISPERVDPFAEGGKTLDLNARGYTQIMKEQMLKAEEQELRKRILDRSRDGEGKSAPKKRGRWDQRVGDVVVPSHKKTPSVRTWKRLRNVSGRRRSAEVRKHRHY